MSFHQYEILEYGGSPVELYEIQNGQNIWRLTSADREINWSAVDWMKENLSRSKIIQSQEGIKNRLTVVVPRDFPPAQNYKQRIPLYPTTLTIYRLHRNDPAQEALVWWSGRVFTVTWPLDKSTANMVFEPGIGSLKTESLRGRWQIRCNHTIYDEFCQLEFVSNSIQLTVTAISTDGTLITLPGLGAATPVAGYWDGGLLRVGSDLFNMITETSGDSMQVWRYMPELTVGTVVRIAPGCLNLKTNCINRFSNFENYLGAPDVPLKDIFTGDGLKGTV